MNRRDNPRDPPAADPILSGELAQHATRSLTAALRSLLFALPIILALSAFSASWLEIVALACFLAAVLALYGVLRSGRLVEALHGIAAMLVAYGLAGGVAFGSVRSTASAAFFGAVVVGGVFLGRRALIAIVVASTASIGGLICAENAGWLRSPDYTVGGTHLAIYFGAICVIALSIYYARSLVIDSLLRLRQAHERIANSEARFETLYRSSPTPASIATLPEGRIVDVNRAYLDFFGFVREHVVGRTGFELGIYRDAGARERAFAQLAAEGRVLGLETELHTASGMLRTTIMSIEPMLWEGRQAAFFQFVDISERRRAEQALRESEQRFAAIFRNSPAAQSLVDSADKIYLDVNPAWCELFGYSDASEIVGRKVSTVPLFSVEERGALGVRIERDGFVDRHEVRTTRRDGSHRMVMLSGRQVRISGGRKLNLWWSIDVTAERAAKELIEELNASLESKVEERTAELKASQDALLHSEKLAALGRLVAGVAHELNTPIGNSLLSATTLNAHAEEFAQQAESGLRRSVLESFVASSRQASAILLRNLEKAAELIRSFKQVAADQTSSQRRGFTLKELVEEVLLAHHPMLKKTAVRISSDVPDSVRMDSYPGPLGQVMGNLITNAVLHGFENRGMGSVTISARLDGEDMVEIAVRDDGRGISEANLKRIFDPFFTTRMGRGGTGLGLSICHRIVTESLGGTIRAASRLKEGCTFTVRIPLRAPSAAQQQAA